MRRAPKGGAGMTATLMTVPIDLIRVGTQPRHAFPDDRIGNLALSMGEVGLQLPLLCGREGDEFLLWDGECRLRAAQRLGWSEIQILVSDDPLDQAQVLTRQLVCNLQRTDLDPVEKARGIRELMQRAGLTGEQVAKRLGIAPSEVSKSLPILKLPTSILEQVACGAISPDSAYQLSRVNDPGEQAVLAAEVAGKPLTRDALARKLRRVRQSEQSANRGPKRVTAALGDGRSISFAGNGLTLDALIDWMQPLIGKAKKAKAQGLSLQEFIRTLKDQAQA